MSILELLGCVCIGVCIGRSLVYLFERVYK